MARRTAGLCNNAGRPRQPGAATRSTGASDRTVAGMDDVRVDAEVGVDIVVLGLAIAAYDRL